MPREQLIAAPDDCRCSLFAATVPERCRCLSGIVKETEAQTPRLTLSRMNRILNLY